MRPSGSHNAVLGNGVRRKFSWGGFIHWHRVDICIWFALFLTSQFYVIVLFPSQRFGEVCWHKMHVFLYIHSPYFMCHCTINYWRPKLAYRRKIHATLRYSSS